MKPGLRLSAALLLAIALRPVKDASAQITTCTLDPKAAASPADKKPADDHDAAGSTSGSAFSQSPIDMLSTSFQDPLTQRTMKEETQRAVRQEVEPPHWRPSASPTRTATIRSVPIMKTAPSSEGQTLDALRESYGPPVEPGSAQDADRIHDGSPRTVAAGSVDASLVGFSKSPNAFSTLQKMSRRLRNAGGSANVQKSAFRLERVWDNAARQGAAPEADLDAETAAGGGSTRFFGLGR
jgi:hypothetical protein